MNKKPNSVQWFAAGTIFVASSGAWAGLFGGVAWGIGITIISLIILFTVFGKDS